MIPLAPIEPFLCPPELPLRAVMERINRLAAPHLFQVVADGERRFQGVVTDGDIRRAFLRGATLETPVAELMTRDAVTGRPGEDAVNARKLAGLHASSAFLALIDDAGHVVGILAGQGPRARVARALVMAGGYGRRLGEHTRNTPKPLLPVAGAPILARVLDHLEAAGVAEIWVAAHYLADQVADFLARRAHKAEVRLIVEEAPLGTAGALARLPDSPDPVLVVNGDVLTDFDLAALAAFHDRHGHDATVAVARHEALVPYGVIHHDAAGSFLAIEEKPVIRNFVAAGIYYLSAAFAGLVARDSPADMPDVLNAGRKLGLTVGLFPIHEYWLDVGRPEDLESAELTRGAAPSDEPSEVE